MKIKNNIQILFCLILVISAFSFIVVGQTDSSLILQNGKMSDDFEDGNINGWDDNMGSHSAEIDNNVSRDTYSVILHDNDQDSVQTGFFYIQTNQTFSMVNNKSFNITVWANPTNLPESTTGGLATQKHGLRISDGTETIFIDVMESDGTDDTSSAQVRGTLVSGTIENNNAQAPTDVWTKYTVEMDYETNTITFYKNDSDIGTTSIAGNWSDPDNLKVSLIANIDSSQDGEFWDINYDDILIEGESTGNITIDIKTYMEHDSQEQYTVTLENEDSTTEDITDQATVSSNNTTIITVDETNNTIISTSDTSINDIASVTAEYDSEGVTLSDSEEITVANATLSNIDILPNTKWLSTFAGVNDAGIQYGLGAEIQWIFFIILMMVTTTHIARSKWVGLGTGEILLILFWLTEFIGLGVFLGSMIFGLFMILTQMNRSSPQINITQRLERKAESELQKSIERDKEGPF